MSLSSVSLYACVRFWSTCAVALRTWKEKQALTLHPAYIRVCRSIKAGVSVACPEHSQGSLSFCTLWQWSRSLTIATWKCCRCRWQLITTAAVWRCLHSIHKTATLGFRCLADIAFEWISLISIFRQTRIAILHLAAQKQQTNGCSTLSSLKQFRRTFWSEQSQNGQTDLIWSWKMQSESLGCRKKT